MQTQGTLILLRHGQSDWNERNLFTGWVDVDLTAKGVTEATNAGVLLARSGLVPDVIHTSVLRRAIRTTNLACERAECSWVPVHRTWRLNERHYGALQGKNKAEVRAEFGDEQFALWRRSFDVPPPAIAPDSEYAQSHDSRYAKVPSDVIPRTECLKDVVVRMMPYYNDRIAPDLLAGKTVLIGAHGNSLRALVKHLDGISDDEIAGLNIPTGIPLVYELDNTLRPVAPGGRYLDPAAATASAAAVAAQGH